MWVWTVDSDVQPVNIGLFTAWLQAQNCHAVTRVVVQTVIWSMHKMTSQVYCSRMVKRPNTTSYKYEQMNTETQN